MLVLTKYYLVLSKNNEKVMKSTENGPYVFFYFLKNIDWGQITETYGKQK